MAKAAAFLVQCQNADGGWGYRVGGMSFVEPTAAVLLALAGPEAQSARQRARDWLLALQHPDGGWGIGAVDAESGWMTACAVLALAGFPDAGAARARGVDWLVATEGIRTTDAGSREQVRSMYRMDASLLGWPWQSGDAAWVHPTALGILALCAAGQAEHPRVRAGVDFLLDRAVEGGGWNIGNPEMLGKVIPANAQDTAVALEALRTAGTGALEPRVAAGIQMLRKLSQDAQTAGELIWGVYGLSRWRIDAGDAPARLASMQHPDGSWEGNPFITATGLQAGQG